MNKLNNGTNTILNVQIKKKESNHQMIKLSDHQLVKLLSIQKIKFLKHRIITSFNQKINKFDIEFPIHETNI